MELKKILNESYSVLTNFDISGITFRGIYSTDLLSAAIKNGKPDNIIITIINNPNTIACAIMIDCPAIILAECETVSEDIINKANENEIVIIKTMLKSYEVVIDFKERGFLE